MDLLINFVRRLYAGGRGPALALGLAALGVACTLHRPGGLEVHRWWSGLGPVIPHDNFPADCSLCHEGGDWNSLRDDFEFDHLAQTGVSLNGAHDAAHCLRCHNDRGPVQVFAARGCAGCHEDVHQGRLGNTCTDCHTETTWRAVGQIELHSSTRFPLVGVHAVTACVRCHPGADTGHFVPTSPECITCHADALATAQNPDHFAFGWIDDCHDCHLPTTWQAAQGF